MDKEFFFIYFIIYNTHGTKKNPRRQNKSKVLSCRSSQKCKVLRVFDIPDYPVVILD